MCRRHYGKAWRAENADHKRVADAAWRAANREKLQADAAEYRKTERKAQADRRWRQANRESESQRRMAWDKANPERLRERMHSLRARRRAAFVEKVDLDNLWDRDNGTCGLCAQPIDLTLAWPHPQSRTLDHIIPLSKGGTHEMANVQLAHALCNARKGNKPPDDARSSGFSPAMEEACP